MSKEAKKEVVVCDGKDKDNYTETYTISSVYKKEQHFLRFVHKDKELSLITATKDKDKSKIKLETFIDDDGIGELCLITDPNQAGRALRLKKDDGTYSFTVEENTKLADAINSEEPYNEVVKKKKFHDFVFKKKLKIVKEYTYYLYNTTSDGKSFFLAVGEDGKLRMDSPPELPEADLEDHDDKKCLFKIHSDVTKVK